MSKSGLSYAYILRKSLHKDAKPHCDESPNWRKNAESQIENMEWSPAYAEPGYTDSPKGILLANWNHFPRKASDLLEQAGYSIEWSDEWSTCCECSKAVRTSPDCYSWQRSYVIFNDCELVCLECVNWSDYLETIEDDANSACMASCDPGQHGYNLISDSAQYESGLHPGQNDKPQDILKALHARGVDHVVFRVSETSQFYATFEVWQRIPDETEEAAADINDYTGDLTDIGG